MSIYSDQYQNANYSPNKAFKREGYRKPSTPKKKPNPDDYMQFKRADGSVLNVTRCCYVFAGLRCTEIGTMKGAKGWMCKNHFRD